MHSRRSQYSIESIKLSDTHTFYNDWTVDHFHSKATVNCQMCTHKNNNSNSCQNYQMQNTYIPLIALSIASDNGLYFVPPPLALLSARVSLSKKCLLVRSRAELHSCTLRVIFVYGPQSNKQKILSQVQSSMCKHNDTWILIIIRNKLQIWLQYLWTLFLA